MKIKTTKQLTAKLDKLFSEYIRRSHSIKEMCRCVTCGKYDHWKDCDAGHYISRQHLSTRFDEKNVFPQCRACNRFHEGRKDEFALFLVKKFGGNILEELNKKKWTPIYSFPFEEKIEEYKEKLKSLTK